MTTAACDAPAVDAHHIIERKLWIDGGYYLDNGASVCEVCHLRAESTKISCDALRERCDIDRVHLPDHLCADESYDKWGNPILANGQRLRGEMFDDEGAQKALALVLHLFTSRVKYPRTFHLPWSPGATANDRTMDDPDDAFGDAEVVVTEKMDGECTTMYRDYVHARSVDYSPHPSRDRVRALHASIAHDIPEGWRLCGENVYAVHSIAYDALPAHFLLFSIWNEKNECLPWDDTVLWAQLLDLGTRAASHTIAVHGAREHDPCAGTAQRAVARIAANCTATQVPLSLGLVGLGEYARVCEPKPDRDKAAQAKGDRGPHEPGLPDLHDTRPSSKAFAAALTASS